MESLITTTSPLLVISFFQIEKLITRPSRKAEAHSQIRFRVCVLLLLSLLLLLVGVANRHF